MYQHILLAVALQRWDIVSPNALAAREVAVALAKGSRAQLFGIEAGEPQPCGWKNDMARARV